MPYVAALRDTAEVVSHDPSSSTLPAVPEETELVLRWLESPGTRLVDLDGEWTCPVGGAGASRAELEPRASSWSVIDHREQPTPRALDRPAGALTS